LVDIALSIRIKEESFSMHQVDTKENRS
jgi:hypothetical protein